MNAKVTMFIILVIAVSMTLALVLMIPKKAQENTNVGRNAEPKIGLAVGSWARYETTLGYFPIGDAQEIQNFTRWVEIRVLNLEGTGLSDLSRLFQP
jgi:hypothetical protein